MSLFGDSPTDNEPALGSTPTRRAGGGGGGLFDDEPASGRNSSNSLFDDGSGASSPWDMPTPRKQQSRAELIRNLLPASDVPESYIETFDAVVREDGHDGQVTAAGIAKLFAVARLDADAQARIMSLVAPGAGSDVSLSRNEFNVVLALIGLAQEGDIISLDGVDERRKDIPRPKLPGLTAEPILPPVAELAAKPPQVPSKHGPEPEPEPYKPEPQPQPQPQLRPEPQPEPEFPPPPSSILSRSTMVDPDDDPWNTPDLHKGHTHSRQNGAEDHAAIVNGHNHSFNQDAPPAFEPRPTNHYSAPPEPIRPTNRPRQVSSSSLSGQGGWGGGFYGSSPGGGFNDVPHTQNPPPIPNIFGGDGAGQIAGIDPSPAAPARSLGGRIGNNVEENVVVTLMPGKEGIFMFQHHNYEVTSQRRGSKVVRRYSDFVWLLDCLHKRYPFRMLPLLPPKRVAVNGNHLSNDGAFIEKRRRGLARFLNALVRHPILSQEQLVIMFLTVPTELAVWRKQATISVQDEFTDRALPPGLEDSLPPTLEDLFTRTRNGVRRSAELYINSCNIMDRLVKRTEGVAADHARVAMSLVSLTEASADTYATDTSEVSQLNNGLTAMSKHLRTCQSLLEDESRGWDEGVLEDLKRQRDALVSLRELFDRRERLDKDNIPYLERRIQANETKLANLRSKPEGLVKPGEIEKVAEAIIKDKESIVQQHNRSIFVKECLRDELITFQSTQYHVSRWNQDWAGERVKYAEMLADNWRRLLDALEAMPLGD
ncbi:sorting nexin mvp-1 [Trichoderma arundinaceum]|uniref:Sorting nexin MVP1 n=1 Tax=Trichoderma arundinaceum TaxID=490622 RepID=A0A395NTV9_TRIAR|nr:sorting nexin mvp-1 [Trichoderma arundinaceum]